MIPELAAHLWQATLFGGAAWLLNLALRKNQACVRYWVWFAASAKFLVPFSLLVWLGAFVPRRVAAPPAPRNWNRRLGHRDRRSQSASNRPVIDRQNPARESLS